MGVSVTVTIDSELLAEAESFGLDVAKMLEREIHRRRAARQTAQAFYDENKESIESYNAYIDKHGPAGRDRGLR